MTVPQSKSAIAVRTAQTLYRVESIDPVWLGGEGYIAGVPVVRIVARTSSGDQMSTHQLIDAIKRAVPADRSMAPSTVAFMGDEGCIDMDFIMAVHNHLLMRVYTEISGTRPLRDSRGNTPIADHICVRVPRNTTKLSDGVLMHSVVVQAPCSPAKVRELSRWLDKEDLNPLRFVAASDMTSASREDAEAVVALAGHGWRLTHPLYHKPVKYPSDQQTIRS